MTLKRREVKEHRLSTPEVGQSWTALAGDLSTRPAPLGAGQRTPGQKYKVSSRYVCRDHYKPITWKGTGCKPCAREKAERLAGDTRRRSFGPEFSEGYETHNQAPSSDWDGDRSAPRASALVTGAPPDAYHLIPNQEMGTDTPNSLTSSAAGNYVATISVGSQR
jgi:hypothetical protein